MTKRHSHKGFETVSESFRPKGVKIPTTDTGRVTTETSYRSCPLIGFYFTSLHKPTMSLAKVPSIHFLTLPANLQKYCCFAIVFIVGLEKVRHLIDFDTLFKFTSLIVPCRHAFLEKQHAESSFH